MSTLVTNIGELVTNDPEAGDPGSGPLGIIHDAALLIDDDRVSWTGPAAGAPAADDVIDVEGRCVVPGFVDSHTHLVFAGDRGDEFAARMTGERYTGGGIARTVAATRAATDDELLAGVRRLVTEMRSQGTTTVEIKSGYGLDVEAEARLLRLASRVTTETTFLGAHVVPAEFAGDRAGYVRLVIGEMLTACAPYARWADVFCEPVSQYAFDGDEARTVLRGRPRRRAGPAGARQPASPPGRASGWPWSSRRPASTTAPS